MFTILAIMAVAATDVAPVARAFGAREAVSQISLSPDGTHVAIIAPSGRGEVLEVADPVKGGEPVVILRSTGDPDRLSSCAWSTDTRLVCDLYMSVDNGMSKRLGYTRLFAVDSDGRNLKVLSAQSSDAIGFAQQGGTIIDMSRGPGGGVLITRQFVPERSTGTMLASSAAGLGVERLDTTRLTRSVVEPARPGAVEYIADGHGTVRIMELRGLTGGG
ncbi:hypothetical protein [Sphingomonas sp.]|uniref:hypothetical protein n=1 Tax=Sphingomonas sp. TaxID=28214 RepID=UPI003B009DE6